MTYKQAIATAAFKKGRMKAIIKETPPGSGRQFLYGFEPISSRSRKNKKGQKLMLTVPENLNELPNRKSARISKLSEVRRAEARRAFDAYQPGAVDPDQGKGPHGEGDLAAPR